MASTPDPEVKLLSSAAGDEENFFASTPDRDFGNLLSPIAGYAVMSTHDAVDPTNNFVASTPDPEMELLSSAAGDEEIFIASTPDRDFGNLLSPVAGRAVMSTHDAADPTKHFVASTPDREVELLSSTAGDEEIFIASTPDRDFGNLLSPIAGYAVMSTHDAADPTKHFVASTPDREVELLSSAAGDEEIFIASTFNTVDFSTLYDCLCTDLGCVDVNPSSAFENLSEGNLMCPVLPVAVSEEQNGSTVASISDHRQDLTSDAVSNKDSDLHPTAADIINNSTSTTQGVRRLPRGQHPKLWGKMSARTAKFVGCHIQISGEKNMLPKQ